MYEFCRFRIKKTDKVCWIAYSLSIYCIRDKSYEKYRYSIVANCYGGDTELLFSSLKTPEEAYKLVDEVCKKYPYIDSDYVDETLPMFEHPLYIQNF